jgi:hypothetical protein
VTQLRFRIATQVRNQAQSQARIWVSVRVRNRVRSYPASKDSSKEVGQDKNVQGKGTSLLRVRDLFVHGNIKFIRDQFNKEIKLNLSQLRRVNPS